MKQPTLLILILFASCITQQREAYFDELKNRGEEQEPKLFEINKENGFSGIVLNNKALLTSFTMQVPIIELQKIDSSRCEYDDGLRNGSSIFYKNWKVLFIENYQKGKLHGISTEYYSNGQRKREVEFQNDSLVIAGKWKENGSKDN